jgi:hypothetical protein
MPVRKRSQEYQQSPVSQSYKEYTITRARASRKIDYLLQTLYSYAIIIIEGLKMTGWDILDKFMSSFPPIATAILMVAAVVVFIVGFSRRGLNFIKYGFGQSAMDSSFETRFDNFEKRFDNFEKRLNDIKAKMATKDDLYSLETKMAANIDRLDTKIETIEVNHFGHLKNFLSELTSILLDKGVLNNQDKARLDNQLRGM